MILMSPGLSDRLLVRLAYRFAIWFFYSHEVEELET
jgi:hypothetical protein